MVARAKEVLSQVDERTRALILCESQKHANTWMHASQSADYA